MAYLFSAKGMEFRPLPFLVMAVCLTVTSCTRDTERSEIAEQSNDPAQANLAQAEAPASQALVPASASSYRAPIRLPQATAPSPSYSNPAQTPQPYPAQYASEPPRASEPQSYGQTDSQRPSNTDQNASQSYEAAPYYPEESAADALSMEAEQPPPPLPQYSQPQCPGDNSLWTPGYWAYAPAGYFWVPGAWVVAPYVGALWTPPYWAYAGSRYHWHRGFWGQHIGFYGGINYGFGYVGRGYEGGYWDRNRRVFNYNRAVNNVNTTTIHNVYNYRVVNNITTINKTRISYNGGRGGVEYRPSPQEFAALREQRIPPVQAQMQHMQQAEVNRAQFGDADHGRPEVLVAARPLATAYREPVPHALAVPEARPLSQWNARQQAATPTNNAPAATGHSGLQPAGQPAVQPNVPAFGHQSPAYTSRERDEPQGNFAPRPGTPAMNSQPAPARSEARVPASPMPVARPETRGPQVVPEQRPAPATRFDQRSAPRPQVEQRPVPEPRMEQRVPLQPAPARSEARVPASPVPIARPETHAPQVVPEQRPAPATRFDQRSAPRPQVEQRPVPEPRVEQRVSPQPAPGPQPRFEPEPPARPLPQPRIEQRPAPTPPRAEQVPPPPQAAPPPHVEVRPQPRVEPRQEAPPHNEQHSEQRQPEQHQEQHQAPHAESAPGAKQPGRPAPPRTEDHHR